ncbi:hypothetical protein D3C79_974600 [compost metagenome]
MIVEMPRASALAPSSAQGEVAAKPSPAPRITRINERAAAAAAPAKIAAHDTPERLGASLATDDSSAEVIMR